MPRNKFLELLMISINYSLLLRVVNNEVNPPVDCYAWAGYLACSLFSKATQLVASWSVARYSDGEMTVNLPI